MKKNAMCGILLCLAFAAPRAAAQSVFSLDEILNPALASELRSQKKLSRVEYTTTPPRLEFFPKTELGKKAPAMWQEEKAPYFTGEMLYLIQKTTAQNDIEKAARVIRAISTLEGIQYYSNTRKKFATLYKTCYMIDGPESRKKIPDVIEKIEDKQHYFYLHDNSFGKCAYTIDFERTDSEVSNFFSNIDPLKILLFNSVKSRHLKIYIVLSDAGDSFLMYFLIQSLFPATPINENVMTKSFTARADAIAQWFEDNYYKAR